MICTSRKYRLIVPQLLYLQLESLKIGSFFFQHLTLLHYCWSCRNCNIRTILPPIYVSRPNFIRDSLVLSVPKVCFPSSLHIHFIGTIQIKGRYTNNIDTNNLLQGTSGINLALKMLKTALAALELRPLDSF